MTLLTTTIFIAGAAIWIRHLSVAKQLPLGKIICIGRGLTLIWDLGQEAARPLVLAMTQVLRPKRSLRTMAAAMYLVDGVGWSLILAVGPGFALLPVMIPIPIRRTKKIG